MTPWLIPALLFQFARPIESGPKDLVLNVDVFRGSAPQAVVASPTVPTATTTLQSLRASGWSGDPARLSTEIRDAARLDRAALVLRDCLTQKKRAEAIRGSDYWVAVRFLYSTTEKVELEIRIVLDDDAKNGGGGAPVRLSAELDKTVIVQTGAAKEPLYAALTLKDPLTLRWPKPWSQARATTPIRPVYPAAARGSSQGGAVIVKALIDADGTLVEPFVLQSLHPDLDAAALDAVRNARYRPATLDGTPIAAMVTVSCPFLRTSR